MRLLPQRLGADREGPAQNTAPTERQVVSACESSSAGAASQASSPPFSASKMYEQERVMSTRKRGVWAKLRQGCRRHPDRVQPARLRAPAAVRAGGAALAPSPWARRLAAHRPRRRCASSGKLKPGWASTRHSRRSSPKNSIRAQPRDVRPWRHRVYDVPGRRRGSTSISLGSHGSRAPLSARVTPARRPVDQPRSGRRRVRRQRSGETRLAWRPLAAASLTHSGRRAEGLAPACLERAEGTAKTKDPKSARS